MIVTWMAYAMSCAAAFAALGACVEYAAGHRTGARRGIWAAMIFASVVLPMATSLLASRERQRVAPAGNELISAGVIRQTSDAPQRDRIALIIWASASAAVGAWLAFCHAQLRRRLRKCSHSFVGGLSVIVSSDFGPALVGMFRPQIVIPAWALGLDDGERQLVLTHELEHRDAHDSMLLFAGAAAVVLFPWNAALWWQLGRLRLAIELDCDSRVVKRHGKDPYQYGELLVTAQRHGMRHTGQSLALAQTRSALGSRIDALVARRRNSVPRIALALATAACLVSAVAFAPAPRIPSLAPQGKHTPPARATFTLTELPHSAPVSRQHVDTSIATSIDDTARGASTEMAPSRMRPVVPSGLTTDLPAPRVAATAENIDEPRLAQFRFRLPRNPEREPRAGGVIRASPSSNGTFGFVTNAVGGRGGGGMARITQRDTSVTPTP